MRRDYPKLLNLDTVAGAWDDLREPLKLAGRAMGGLLVHPDFSNALPGLIAEAERAAVVEARLKGMST